MPPPCLATTHDPPEIDMSNRCKCCSCAPSNDQKCQRTDRITWTLVLWLADLCRDSYIHCGTDALIFTSSANQLFIAVYIQNIGKHYSCTGKLCCRFDGCTLGIVFSAVYASSLPTHPHTFYKHTGQQEVGWRVHWRDTQKNKGILSMQKNKYLSKFKITPQPEKFT